MPNAATPQQSGGAPSVKTPATKGKKSPKPRVLMLSLEKESHTDQLYAQLYRALRKNAVVTEVCHARSANKALSDTALPSAILVSDTALTRPKHAAVLARLVAYARGGGRVVLGMQLSSHIQMGLIGPFFRAWGLAWDWGSLHRTTFGLNPAGVPAPLDPGTLFPACSMQALHVKNVPRVCAVYLRLPTAASRLESAAYYAPTPAAGDQGEETPAAFARVGDGYVGYVGDVNGEQGSIRLTLEMCGVKIQPGDLGAADRLTGVVLEIHPDGSTVDERRRDEEIPLPPPALPSTSASTSASVASAILKSPPTSVAGSRSAGKSALSSSAPVFVPTKRWTLGRPREAEVIARAAQRAQVRAAKIARADALKEEGNALFRGQADQWAQAAEKYRAAAFAAGPQPVYLTNLAAALLKLKLWTMAESAASRVLLQEPGYPKALFRRAQARKEQARFKAAEADLRRILAKDRSNASALAELDSVRALKRTKRSVDLPGDSDDEPYEDVPDLEEFSDSEDSAHEGSGTPCRPYNHSGCTSGARCRYSHAPDKRSVRDELGRNVCVYWLLDECRFSAEQCVYAHERTYLPTGGGQWWEDAARNARVRAGMHATCAAAPSGYWEVLLAEAAKPDPWRTDLWATGAYAPAGAAGTAAQGKTGATAGGPNGKKRGNGKGRGWSGRGPFPRSKRGSGGSGASGGNPFGYESEDYYGHMDDFYGEMIMQGVKPWEVDSYDELAAIHGALYDDGY